MAVQVLNKKRKKAGISWRGALVLIFFLTPFWMLLVWYLSPKRKLVVAIIDKTVIAKPGQEHLSLLWVLHQERFTKNNNQLYNADQDYFGFFPLKNEQYELKGLERFNAKQLEKLSNDAEVAYVTDSYGVFRNEWYQQGNDQDRSGMVYGGMSEQDIFFLQQMKERKKLVIAEFNAIGSPTAPAIRESFERLFGMQWSGWTGRYFESFDTTANRELPAWLIDGYRRTHDGKWPFRNSGIALIHADNDRVEILENGTHLTNPLPYIVSTKEAMDHYGLPKSIKYSFWFDIISNDTMVNETIADFNIHVNKEGKQLLAANGIPSHFPAITRHIAKDYQFFYFSADFCDNPISMTTSYFKGIGLFKWMMYTSREPLERKSFFWKVYRPLMTGILNDHYRSLHP